MDVVPCLIGQVPLEPSRPTYPGFVAEDAGNRPSNTPVAVTTDDLVGELARLRTEVEALRSENERLRRFVPADISGVAAAHQQIWSPSLFGPEPSPATLPPITAASPLAERLGLLRSLFRPREDVYAHRWEGRNGRTGWSPVYKGGFAGRRAPKPEYLPLTDDALAAHVEGQLVIGIYPLLQGDRTGFVAVDFDKGSWALDALAYVDAAQQAGVPTALEVSRSGRGTGFDCPNGGHPGGGTLRGPPPDPAGSAATRDRPERPRADADGGHLRIAGVDAGRSQAPRQPPQS